MRSRLLALGLAATALVGSAALGAAPSGPVPGPMEDASVEVGRSTDNQQPFALTAGLWRDELAPSDRGHFFSYSRSDDSTMVHVSVIGLGASGDQIELSASAGDTSCGSTTANAGYVSDGPARVFGASLLIGEESDGDCVLQREDLRIEVSRGTSTGDLEPLPIQIKVVEEERLDDAQEHADPSRGALVEPDGLDHPFQAPSGAARTGTIAQGEQHYYRVPLDWGQQLAAQVDVEALGGDSYSGPELRLDLLGPMRTPLDPTAAEVTPSASLGIEESTVLTTGVGPVRYRERHEGGETYLPGDHWVVVTLASADEDEEPISIDYRLGLEVQNERTDVPVYRGGDQPFLIGPDQWAASPSGNGLFDADGDDDASTRRWAAAGLGLFGLLCIGLGVTWVRRARRA